MKNEINSRIEIIAELAQGFEGRPGQSRLLLKAAAAAGANAAKYQLVYADELATPDYEYYDLFRSLEMGDETWIDLASYASELGIRLYLDIFGVRSLRLAERIGVPGVKLHGTDIANIGLLEEVADSSVPKILLGAGGAYSDELKLALRILSDKRVDLILGYQGYPTPNDANQIARVKLLANSLVKDYPNVVMGFADHAMPDNPLRYAMAATAIGAGAQVIEKHLTLGQVMKLEDYESALNPDEFAEFCSVIRDCDEALGVSKGAEDFGMSEAEIGYRKMIRRHVIASKELLVGERLTPADVVLKRSSSDHVITDPQQVYGRILKHPVAANAAISPADID